jgi:RNA recognition motif-containing protein
MMPRKIQTWSGDVDGWSVYVGNLAYVTVWQDIKDHMRTAGDVLRAEVMTMNYGRSKGCGIVEYVSMDGATRSIVELNDSELNGRQIFVREDREGGKGGGAREGGGGYLAGPYRAAGFGSGAGTVVVVVDRGATMAI